MRQTKAREISENNVNAIDLLIEFNVPDPYSDARARSYCLVEDKAHPLINLRSHDH